MIYLSQSPGRIVLSVILSNIDLSQCTSTIQVRKPSISIQQHYQSHSTYLNRHQRRDYPTPQLSPVQAGYSTVDITPVSKRSWVDYTPTESSIRMRPSTKPATPRIIGGISNYCPVYYHPVYGIYSREQLCLVQGIPEFGEPISRSVKLRKPSGEL